MEKSFRRASEDFESFYLRHFQAIYRVCYAFMKNPQDAEDCTEDTFVRAITSDAAFENERHERAWLTTTAMNICKDKLKHWWMQKVSDIDEQPDIPDSKTEETAAEGCCLNRSWRFPKSIKKSCGFIITKAIRQTRLPACSAARRLPYETGCVMRAVN